jgi:hypothetical protein
MHVGNILAFSRKLKLPGAKKAAERSGQIHSLTPVQIQAHENNSRHTQQHNNALEE